MEALKKSTNTSHLYLSTQINVLNYIRLLRLCRTPRVGGVCGSNKPLQRHQQDGCHPHSHTVGDVIKNSKYTKHPHTFIFLHRIVLTGLRFIKLLLSVNVTVICFTDIKRVTFTHRSDRRQRDTLIPPAVASHVVK